MPHENLKMNNILQDVWYMQMTDANLFYNPQVQRLQRLSIKNKLHNALWWYLILARAATNEPNCSLRYDIDYISTLLAEDDDAEVSDTLELIIKCGLISVIDGYLFIPLAKSSLISIARSKARKEKYAKGKSENKKVEPPAKESQPLDKTDPNHVPF